MEIQSIKPAVEWMQQLGWLPQPFQQDCWLAYLQGENGLLNAPTGSGKTYALMLAPMLEALANKKVEKGLKLLWITPVRALARDIQLAAEKAFSGLNLSWQVAVRSGDSSQAEKTKQTKQMPDVLITTPESLHLLLSHKNHAAYFKNLRLVVADEWHELMGNKRGVQVELALSRLKSLAAGLRIWGISATIGNMLQAKEVLLGDAQKGRTIVADIQKKIEIKTLIPQEMERFPWAGHLGIKMLEQVLPIIEKSRSTLLFTNTRSFAEVWYQKLLDFAPHLAGQVAMHHGSISAETRQWVEEQLHSGQLKAVVCTSSLDLGVDFRPVETIIQIGSPKGISRLLQRAGRSGHHPGATSTLWLVPTHSLELLEAAALKQAITQHAVEDRIPHVRAFDVLIQYLMTLAVGEGFYAEQVYNEIKNTHCYASLSEAEFAQCLTFITNGGNSLYAYDEFQKAEREADGKYVVKIRKIAMMHRLSIGTIVSDLSISVVYRSGKRVGQIEEWFVSRLKPGDVFWLAGKNLELLQLHHHQAIVKPAEGKKGQVPSWMGGRMPLSSNLSQVLRQQIPFDHEQPKTPELMALKPLFDKQKELSALPHQKCFLIEKIKTKEGHHLFAFPFEGRFVNEGIASLLAYRLSLIKPFTCSIAMNDYGFELVSDQDIPIEMALDSDIFSSDYLHEDLQRSINAVELSSRKFRDIARISGLIFQGYPGAPVKTKHLQSNSKLFFDVFREHEPDQPLLLQAYDEVRDFELEESRLRKALARIRATMLVITYPEKPTPFAFPILVDRLNRGAYSNETTEERVKKILQQMREVQVAD